MLSSYLTAQAEFSIWRSLRSQCIKLSCSNCCLLHSPVCPVIPMDRMSKLFFPQVPLALSICRDLICCSCFTLGETLKCTRWRLQALVNPLLSSGFCPTVSFTKPRKLKWSILGCRVLSSIFPSLFFWAVNNHKQIMCDSIHESIDSISLEIHCAFHHWLQVCNL